MPSKTHQGQSEASQSHEEKADGMIGSLTVWHLVQVVLRKSRHGGCKSEVESGMGSNGSICSAFSILHYRSKKQESYASSTCTVCMSNK